MGIPKFFRYICERYPCILQPFKENEVPDFDYLYLDMNGIVHICSNSKEPDGVNTKADREIFNDIFHQIEVLFYMIKPKKLLFLAVDGVAPRAKMNQQRGRRYASRKGLEIVRQRAIAEGTRAPDDPGFESNCITPGTEFMMKLKTHLEYFVTNKISSDPMWRRCKVVLSGQEVPGEGEHKIMDYMRYMKTLPDYNPNASHCLYGADGDFFMLGLSIHEKNICLLREGLNDAKAKSLSEKYYMVYLGILREYIELEFQDLKDKLPFEFDLCKIIDDWVLLIFLIGNDFIPHLPNLHIVKGALPVLYEAYAEVLPTLDGYLNQNGCLNVAGFQKFMLKLADFDLKAFEETFVDLSYLEGKMENLKKSRDNEKPMDPELAKLIKATNEELGCTDDELSEDEAMDGIGENERDNSDRYNSVNYVWEFSLHKENYYKTKFNISEVDDEFLREQAESYIRGLQWILYYYYRGCKSWLWYYPHHYAPFASDVNVKELSLDFEMGKPVLPFVQLMAVLPPLSKGLVPIPYHNLMTSSNSPIKHFYPEDFETDLNGKQNDWEAVVLLPFIDLDELQIAMEEGNSKLTKEELNRNRHGPMYIYSYTNEDQGTYEGPGSFPPVRSNHAFRKTMWKEELYVDHENMNPKQPDPKLILPRFPTFRYISYKVVKKKNLVKKFSFITRNDSLILTVEPEENPETETVAKELLGRTVHVNWPFFKEARVVAVADEDAKYSKKNGKSGIFEKQSWDKAGKVNWLHQVDFARERFLEWQGIDIGSTEILVYVEELQGFSYSINKDSKVEKNKIWSESVVTHPLQLVVKDMKLHEEKMLYSIEEAFPVDSFAFSLDHLHYGCLGKVIGTSADHKLKLELEMKPEPNVTRSFLYESSVIYYSANAAATKIGISKNLLFDIAGTIIIDLSPPGSTSEPRAGVNIGLSLKNNKREQEVPGFTRKVDNGWMFSNKAIDVIREYIIKFPRATDFISGRNKKGYIYHKSEIFPDSEGNEKINEIVSWIKGLECSKVTPVQWGSEILDPEVISRIEKIIDETPKKNEFKTIYIDPQSVYKSDLVSRGLPPDPKAKHQLLDRVVWCNSSSIVPLGLRGYIIALLKVAPSSDEYMYDILYDESFPGGITLNCSPGRGYRSSRSSFINITHAERNYHLSKPKSDQPETTRSQSSAAAILSKVRPMSAFAQWNQYPPAPLYEDKAEQFKTLWSYLEKVKSRDETKVLKKLLKIEEDDEKPKIEDNVKTFFENISKSADNMIPKTNTAELENVKMILQKSQKQPEQPPLIQSEKPYRLQLLHYIQSLNLGKPVFQLNVASDAFVGLIMFPDGRVFKGSPCRDEESAYDSAACVALAVLSNANEENGVHKENERARKILESHPIYGNGLLLRKAEINAISKNQEVQKTMVNVKSKLPNEKLNRNNCKPQPQNHRRNNVPHELPTPPLQWCKQYKNSSSMYVEQYKSNPSYPSEDHKGKPDQPHGKNENIAHHPHLDNRMGNNFRSYSNWRQDDKIRTQPGDIRFTNYISRFGNHRQRPNIVDPLQSVTLRPDVYYAKQGGGPGAHDKNLNENLQVQGGSNGTCQRLSAVATEFIPLQALTRNRNRGNTMNPNTKHIREPSKKVQTVSQVKVATSSHEEKLSISTKQKRKSKIAAKFDTEWDPQC